MTDERKLINEVDRARLAKQITDNPLWLESWDVLTTKLVSAWTKSKDEDREKRERLYALLRATESARAYIEQIIETGKMAAVSLSELERSRK